MISLTHLSSTTAQPLFTQLISFLTAEGDLMSRCRISKRSAVTGKVILVCDLDENHGSIFPKHWDKVECVYWEIAPVDPVPVPATRIKPPKTDSGRATRKSLAAHVSKDTTAFVVVND